MTSRPTRETVEGRAYLDLQNLARRTGRPTDELHQLYALEGFLDRLVASQHADKFVLKGGVLLAAYETRRPTRDVDLSASSIVNEAEAVRQLVADILSVDVDDGLVFDLEAITAETIRDDDVYSGVRVNVRGQLSSAKLRFHVDVNVGDPITPSPSPVVLPRLLGGKLEVVGYPIEMVLAEKIVTAVERGTANTRWRDFVDIAALAAGHEIEGDSLRRSVQAVAEHRQATLASLTEVLEGYSDLAQHRWVRWRAKQQLEGTTPGQFQELLDQVIALADPVLSGAVAGRVWDPESGTWP